MSLLMFSHSPDAIVVVTDTLATDPTGEPSFFKSKTFIVPHLQLVVAMTGLANVGESLITTLFTSLLARDIDMAATHTQLMLRKIEVEVSEQNGASEMTSTIYYFGFSERAGQYVRYTFRSANGFDPELDTIGGFGVKPVPDGSFDTPETLDDWIALAERIRAEQSAFPAAERIHIGGELQLTSMANAAITSSRVYRFADIEDQWNAMHDHHNAWS